MGMGSGGILEGGEGLVAHKALAKGLGALCTDVVAVETARRSRITASAAADSRIWVCGSVLDARERLVDFESLGDVLCALRSEVVVPETANASRIAVSAAIDT